MYSRLIDRYYASEAPLPESIAQCCMLVRAKSSAAKKAVANVIPQFFSLLDQQWRQKRCDEEIERFKEKSTKAKASIKARWHPSDTNVLRTNNERNTNQNQNQNHIKDMSESPSVIRTIRFDDPPGFLSFWSSFPNFGRRTKRKDCLQVWRKRSLEPLTETIVAHVKAMALTPQWRKNGTGDHFEPLALTYLRAECWQDGLPDAAKPPEKKLAL